MIESPIRVVLDANVLFPALLRDTLLRAAEHGLLHVHWSNEVMQELERNLITTGAMNDERATNLVRSMNSAFPDASVRGYEHHLPLMRNEAKDRHVAAAAVHADAALIVTFNLRDFRDLPDGIRAIEPTALLCRLLDDHPTSVVALLREQAAFLKRPPSTLHELLNHMNTYLGEFADAVRAALANEQE